MVDCDVISGDLGRLGHPGWVGNGGAFANPDGFSGGVNKKVVQYDSSLPRIMIKSKQTILQNITAKLYLLYFDLMSFSDSFFVQIK